MIVGSVALIAFFAGCSKLKQIANINVDIPYTAQIAIPPLSVDTAGAALPAGGLSISLPSVSFATNSAQYIAQYHTAANMIINVDLESLSLQLAAPANQNFDFLDSVQLYISADGQPEVMVAWLYSVPKGQSTINLSTNKNVNLKNYFVKTTMTYRLQAHINAVPASSTLLNIGSVFHMLANPLN